MSLHCEQNDLILHYYNDGNEEEQWGYGNRDDMKAQFEQDLYNKIFTLQDQGKEDEIDTLENRIKFSINIISNAEGSVRDNFYDIDDKDKGLEETV